MKLYTVTADTKPDDLPNGFYWHLQRNTHGTYPYAVGVIEKIGRRMQPTAYQAQDIPFGTHRTLLLYGPLEKPPEDVFTTAP